MLAISVFAWAHRTDWSGTYENHDDRGKYLSIGTASIVKNHLLWGTVLVLIGYGVATWGILVTQGSAASTTGGFAVVTTVDMVFGRVGSGLAAVCIMLFFVMVPVIYNVTFSRLLLVEGIDQRLPVRIAHLNRDRVPATAIIFQSSIAIVFTCMAFLVVPYVGLFGIKPSDLSIDVYNVSQATATLVWATSSSFFFVDIVVLYLHDKHTFQQQHYGCVSL